MKYDEISESYSSVYVKWLDFWECLDVHICNGTCLSYINHLMDIKLNLFSLWNIVSTLFNQKVFLFASEIVLDSIQILFPEVVDEMNKINK